MYVDGGGSDPVRPVPRPKSAKPRADRHPKTDLHGNGTEKLYLDGISFAAQEL